VLDKQICGFAITNDCINIWNKQIGKLVNRRRIQILFG
jgi:hypothetical protein